MDLQGIASRTRLPLRKLRYVLDHRMLPGMRVKHNAALVGNPRWFSELEGLAIYAAASLLESGVRREVIESFLDVLSEPVFLAHTYKRRVDAISATWAQHQLPSMASLGDGINVRLRLGGYDSGWVQPKTFVVLENYIPRVSFELNLGRLRDDLRVL